LAASAPQFQSGWRIPLKPPIELSNINVLSPEADDREAAAEDDAK
jgi:hypothetical protein